jgi:predicted RecB family endonuclease
MGEWSTREIAEQLGVEHTDILMFQEENVSDIAEVKAALTGQLAIETAGLWVAKKHNRIAEMQEDIEDINDILKTMREQGLARVTNSDLGTKRHYNLLRGKLALLRNVADELDARVLPPGSKPGDGDDTNVVHYVIEADDITSAIT